MKNWHIVIYMMIVSCFIFENVQAKKLRIFFFDDLFESALKAEKRLPTSQKVFKNSSSFDEIYDSYPRKFSHANEGFQDSQQILKRLRLSPESDLGKRFARLPSLKQNQFLGLMESARHILQSPGGAKSLERIGKEGLVVVNRYGDQSYLPLKRTVMDDRSWRTIGKSIQSLEKVDYPQQLKLMSSLKKANYKIKPDTFNQVKNWSKNNIINDFTRVSIAGKTIKQYGRQGLKNLWDFSSSMLKKHPGKIAIGTAVAIALVNPELVLSPLGKLRKNAEKLFEEFGKEIGKTLTSPLKIVSGVKKGFKEESQNIADDLTNESSVPNSEKSTLNKFINSTIYFIFLGFIALIVLYIFPPTRSLIKATGKRIFGNQSKP
jgi:hypothetical protein